MPESFEQIEIQQRRFPRSQGGLGNFPGGSGQGFPMGPPPVMPPTRPFARGAQPFAVDARTIQHCVGRFTYIWLDNGHEFWLFPIQVGQRSVAGFRWIPRIGWSYMGISLNRIDFFTCV
jgi:hypothetical protein